MDRRLYGALVAAPAVAVGLYALYAYRSKKSLYFWFNVPYSGGRGTFRGLFVKARNFIYRNTIQDRLWNYIEARSEEGNADSVLAAFDDYCYNYEWTWAIGDKKAAILAKVVQEAKPKVTLELGTFLGYSAIIIAQNMPSDGKLITVEANPKSAEIAKKIISRAGFGDKVTVVVGYTEDIIPELHHNYNIETLDMVFLDHKEDAYVPDLQRLEKGGFLHNGSVVFADNVTDAMDFSKYIRNSNNYVCKFYEGSRQYGARDSDGMERGIFRGADMFSGETLGL
ncbi:catechol O-methyltransferase-like isoform X2 [Amphiura filiformis]|uniref:catechol O-methyltransferase-like isoform X2 n=1 Tax=Amphiura filiformis TaxID=82378 RepID=UPI003B212DA5